MRKAVLFAAAMMLGAGVFAQKAEFKKDAYKMGDEVVAKVEEKRSGNLVNKNFTILDNSGNELITMNVKVLVNPLGFNNFTWYEVNFVPLNKTVTRNVSESIIGARKELLGEFATLEVIGKNGLNAEGVDAYVTRHSLDLGKINQAKADSLQDMKSRSTVIIPRDKGAKVTVNYDHSIVQDGKQIGTWEKYSMDNSESTGSKFLDRATESKDARFIIKNTQGGIVGIVTREQGVEAKVDIAGFFNGDNHHFSGSEAGISFNDKDTELVKGFVLFMIRRNNM